MRLRNVADAADRRISFADSVLEMHCADDQGASGMISDGEIHDVLVAGL